MVKGGGLRKRQGLRRSSGAVGAGGGICEGHRGGGASSSNEWYERCRESLCFA